MRVAMLGCPFQTSYGAYIEALTNAIGGKTGTPVQWVASNCGCGDPIERSRLFQTEKCTYFEMRQIGSYASKSPWKRSLRLIARNAGYYFRAARYAELSGNADVVHFQQILNAFGSDVVFHWLKRDSKAARVITVHELDSEQTEFPERNSTYNRADAIIAHSEEIKKGLVALKVNADLIHVVHHGADIPSATHGLPREGIVFYGGHKLMVGKGIETIFKAMALLRQRLGGATPRLRIHGHYGTETPAEGLALAEKLGIADSIEWLNQIPMKDMTQLYASSILLALPYTGSFAGLPAATAAAYGLPIVATRKAGIPEHIGDCGVWVRENDPVDLADRIGELVNDKARCVDLAAKLQRRAQEHLSWDVVADATLRVYRAALERRAAERTDVRS